MKAFLEISIGDIAEHKEQLAAYDRAARFYVQQGASYGYGHDTVDDLTDEEAEILRDIYEADPAWRSKGPCSFRKPSSLVVGRMIVSLYNKDCPKTCENFIALCTGSKGMCKNAPTKPLHYLGNRFHRLVPGFIAQAGDLTGKGTGESIWGKAFNDEVAGLKKISFKGRRGRLGMANSGKNSNTSQFFFTLTDDVPHKKLDGRYVCFGEVVEGFTCLDAINAVPSTDEMPSKHIFISDCGQIDDE